MFQVGTKNPSVVSRRSKLFLGMLATVTLIACGGRVDGSSPVDDTTPIAPMSPASRSLPNVRSGGGQTLKAPRVVPIFFGSDAREAELTSFLNTIPGSDYWKQTTAEYAVGDITIGQAVHAQGELPASMTNLELKEWFINRFNGTTNFPVLDTNAVYTIFLQPHTVVSAPWGRSCLDYHAYHGEAVISGKRVAFAVVPRCPTGSESEIDSLTRSVSHELVEAATDPFVDSHPAYGLPDDRSLGWALGAGSEVTDLCAFEPAAYGELVGGHSVARSWSNAAASAGHDPCVPAVAGPYYNAEPIFPEMMTFKLGAGKTAAKSIQVHVGQSRTIDVMPFADGDIDAWTMDAQDQQTLYGGSPELKLMFDDKTAHPGEVRHLSIERLKDSPSGATTFVIFSHVGSAGHHWWGVVSN